MSSGARTSRLGAHLLEGERCRFQLWAPRIPRVDLHLLTPIERWIALEPTENGYHEAVVDDVTAGSSYRYRLSDRGEYPDPASRHQPEGVHGPSRVVAPDFPWTDEAWRGLLLAEHVFYEIHVGTFSREGTFDAVAEALDEIVELGVTAIELMPVAQFPGSRNWGYDGAYPFAVQHSYGGPGGLRRLVDRCHAKGLAVVLDVVYNHLGPEGNYLAEFGPYFTERYRTPWGGAINFDGPASDEVRRFFRENALFWLEDYHLDGLRLDAVHAILDASPRPFLEELAAEVKHLSCRLRRPLHLIAESSGNDPRLIRSRELGGYALDALWNDDFHHSLGVLLTGDREGYYRDYGELAQLEKAFRDGFVYSGEHSPFRNRRHGASSRDIPAERFVVFAQNHDQVGNRMLGDRLSQRVDLERLKLAAGAVILSPFLPLLFMGEEYGEAAPFAYFVEHSEPALIDAVRRGRQEEFASFEWAGPSPDPQDEGTFLSSKLDRRLREKEPHRTILELHRELLRLRKETVALARPGKEHTEVRASQGPRLITLHRRSHREGSDETIAIFHFGAEPAAETLRLVPGLWRKIIDSASERWLGPGSSLPEEIRSDGLVELRFPPWSFVLYRRDA